MELISLTDSTFPKNLSSHAHWWAPSCLWWPQSFSGQGVCPLMYVIWPKKTILLLDSSHVSTLSVMPTFSAFTFSAQYKVCCHVALDPSPTLTSHQCGRSHPLPFKILYHSTLEMLTGRGNAKGQAVKVETSKGCDERGVVDSCVTGICQNLIFASNLLKNGALPSVPRLLRNWNLTWNLTLPKESVPDPTEFFFGFWSTSV